MNELVNLDRLRDVLEEYAVAVRNLYQDNLVKSGRIASGDLLNSVECHVALANQEFVVSLTLRDYWQYVEEDTRPHWPPRDAILSWIQVKPILPRPDANGRIPTPETLAYLIGRAMAGKSPNQANLKNPQGGTTGTHDLAKAVEEMNAQYRARISEALGHDLEWYIRKIVAEG
ncbi:MAG: hypothetical protein IKE76_09510 [Clostridia bacterium]|nr:hypothetical protein [Clostridia bacterium]